MGDQAIWQAEGVQKRAAVQSMFGQIAPTYDRLNGLISFNLHHRWRAYAVSRLHLKSGDTALDVCCGTGDFMLPLRNKVGAQGKVVGVDFSLPMLQVACKKQVPGPVNLGDACRLPIQTSSIDAVSVGWGIRNVPNIDQAHREFFRVLKPGGWFVSLDMARPRIGLMRAASEFVFNRLVPWLGSKFGKTEAYTYLPKSTQKFSTREELKESMIAAGFTEVAYKDLFFGNVCCHWGRKP